MRGQQEHRVLEGQWRVPASTENAELAVWGVEEVSAYSSLLNVTVVESGGESFLMSFSQRPQEAWVWPKKD